MKLLTAHQMQALEHRANENGLGFDTMMENAGLALATLTKERTRDPHRLILVLVGPGNNGGDGLVAARYLAKWGLATTVYIWKRSRHPDPPLARAVEQGIPIHWAAEDPQLSQLRTLLGDCDIVLDALLGTGVSGELRPELRSLLETVRDNASKRPPRPSPPILRKPTDRVNASMPDRPLVIAVDLPSGMNSDTGQIDPLTPSADITITFGFPKRGQFLFPGAASIGELVVADIGISHSLADDIMTELATPDQIAAWLPTRPADANKGTFGKVLIVAGSRNYVGAPRLAALAAYRGGVGLVTCALGSSVYPVVASSLTEPTFLLLPDDMGAIAPDAEHIVREQLAKYDALLVGPGLGTETGTDHFVRRLFGMASSGRRASVGFRPDFETSIPLLGIPIVLDADAINLIAPIDGWWHHLPPNTILTPHPGEMARLMHCSVAEVQADRLGIARQAADTWGCTIILKGAHTVICSSDELTTVLPFANSALATAGTGDVLAGLVVGLRAQGLSAHRAATCGAYLHAMAGELGCSQYGKASLMASDLLDCIPQAYQSVQAP